MAATPEADAAGSAPGLAAHPGHRGTRAVQRMVEFAPSTGGLALWVHHRDLTRDLTRDLPRDRDAGMPSGDAAPPVFTDGHTVFYSPAFDTLPLPEQVGLVAHEVLHIALRHPQRLAALQALLGDVDRVLFNVCADAIVNSTLAHLSWLQLPARAALLDRLLASALSVDEPVEKSLLEWDVERLYRAVDDRRPASGRRSGDGRSSQRGGGDGAGDDDTPGAAPRQTAREHRPPEDGPRAARVRQLADPRLADLAPGPDTPTHAEDEAEHTREWSQRLLRAHAGDGVHSMLRALIADLPQIRTPWEQVLRTQLARHLSPQLAVSWSRPSRSYLANQGRAGPGRRMPFEPGWSPGKAVPRLVLVVDVSGSIEDALMARFAGEIESITRRLAASVVLVIGDDRVQRVTTFQPGRAKLRDIVFQGGGGTDFTPMLLEADAHHPDITVVLTDLDGPARHRPRAPVLWAVPEAHAQAVQPFGRKLTLR